MATPKKIVQKKISPVKNPAPKKIEEEEVKDLPTEESSEEMEEEEEEVIEEKPKKLKSSAQAKEEEEANKVEEEDYLRQYQYKKVNNQPKIGGLDTDPDKGSKAEVMKAFLLKEPKVSVLIPLPEGTDPKVPYSVTRNGYRLDLPTNTYLELPKAIVEMIVASNNQTIAALNQFKIEGNKEKENNL